MASAAPIPDRPQGSTPEQLPFSGSNSPSGSSVGQFPAEEKKPNFISRVIKPLQDFGFGKMAFMEGGVGLFVFAGIGTYPPLFVLCRSHIYCRHMSSAAYLTAIKRHHRPLVHGGWYIFC